MPRSRKILYIVFAFVAAFFVYSFFMKPEQGTPLVTETPLLSGQDVKGRELLNVLLSLNNITLDDEVFSSPLFENLQDFSITLPDTGATGRGNPFAPIGVEEPASQ